MRGDWDRRAREDARYYAAFGRREQDEEEFQSTAGDVVRNLDCELRRLPRDADRAALRALEIGCGPGRILLPMSRRFGEVHGVDVSGEMIRLAREKLAGTPNTHVQVNRGSDLSAFEEDFFDFVYSYAVFQHIPSREVVFGYLREARRVLKAGGLVRCQLNGLHVERAARPATPAVVPADSVGEAADMAVLANCSTQNNSAGYDTWHGVRIGGDEIRGFARGCDFQLLALEGAGTQYMWITLRKRPAGWHAQLPHRAPSGQAVVRRVTNAFSSEPLAPARGRFAVVSLWIESLPDECDLLRLEATVGGLPAIPFYIGPRENDGLSQLNLALPSEIGTGLQPVSLTWLGGPLCPPATLRVVPPGPAVPRLVTLSDAVDLLSGNTVRSGIVKLVLEDVEQIGDLSVSFDGGEVGALETFCVDPLPMRYEVNVHLPSGTPPGGHSLEIALGRRRLGSFRLQIL
jgi:SAM-dependent methyltransferase